MCVIMSCNTLTLWNWETGEINVWKCRSARYESPSAFCLAYRDRRLWTLNGLAIRPKVQTAQAEFCPPCTGMPVSQPNCLKNCLSMSNDDVSTIDGAVIFDKKYSTLKCSFWMESLILQISPTPKTLISELHGLKI